MISDPFWQYDRSFVVFVWWKLDTKELQQEDKQHGNMAMKLENNNLSYVNIARWRYNDMKQQYHTQHSDDIGESEGNIWQHGNDIDD